MILLQHSAYQWQLTMGPSPFLTPPFTLSKWQFIQVAELLHNLAFHYMWALGEGNIHSSVQREDPSAVPGKYKSTRK